MRITKQALLDAVEFPSSIVKPRSSNAMFSYLRMEAKSNRLSVTACDCDQYCTQESECEGDMDALCVSISQFKNLYSLFSGDVGMSAKENKIRLFSNGEYVLNTLPAEQFPAWNQDKQVKIGVGCSALAEGIKRVVFAAAKHDEKPSINCVHVITYENRILCEACNGRDYASIENKLICGKSDFLVSLPFVNNFCTALKREGAVLCVSENSIGVVFSGGEYHCKQLVNKFLNVSAMEDWSFSELGEISPHNWTPAFRSILDMAGKQSTTVISAKVSPKFIEYIGTNGQISASVSDRLKECDLNLSAIAFLPCLEAFNGEKAKISLCNETKALKLQQGDLTVITMQLR